MLQFDQKHYESVVDGALSLRKDIEAVADQLSQRGYKNVFLIGVGGTYAHALSLKSMLTNLTDLDVYAVIASELMSVGDRKFGKDSLCVFSSRTGNTKEIVEAAQYCKQAGATVISFVSHEGTPLCDVSDHVFLNFAVDENLAESIYLQNIPFLFRLAYQKGDFPDYDRFMNQLSSITPYLVKAKETIDPICQGLAKKHKDTGYHMVVGSGNVWGETYDYAMCILEEMQWIKTKSIHAAEFFHGTLELVEKDTSMILLYGEDESRPLMDRVLRFAQRFTDEIMIFDSKTVDLPLDEAYRKYLSPLVIYTLTERFSAHLSEVRNHPLTTRRYYRQMEY